MTIGICVLSRCFTIFYAVLPIMVNLTVTRWKPTRSLQRQRKGRIYSWNSQCGGWIETCSNRNPLLREKKYVAAVVTGVDSTSKHVETPLRTLVTSAASDRSDVLIWMQWTEEFLHLVHLLQLDYFLFEPFLFPLPPFFFYHYNFEVRFFFFFLQVNWQI